MVSIPRLVPHARKKRLRVTLLVLPLIVLTSTGARCQDSNGFEDIDDHHIPYELSNPAVRAWLPKKLDEISGLTVLDSSRIAAVEDEEGVVYVLDAESFELLSEHEFGGDGDYEGIEAVGNDLFVLRSDGMLFHLKDWRHREAREVTRIDTPLSGRHDTEGLALERDGSSLLIACKEYPGKGFKGKRTVYRYDTVEKQTEPRPALVFDAVAAEKDQVEGIVSRTVRRLMDIRRFKPSGLAVHPYTGEIYVVSSVSHSLAVFDSLGSLTGLSKLDKDLLHQPEGIAFLPDGDLLISSEANGKRGRLVRFKYLQRP